MNCDHCPTHWVLVVNETRAENPEWKKPFDYEEGCFPCASCVSDLIETTENLNSSLAPIMDEFGGKESSFFAFRRLNYIEEDVQRLMPEIELLNPQEGSRRLQPLEAQVAEQQKRVKSLNVDYKLNVMDALSMEATELGGMASEAVTDMGKVGVQIMSITKEMREIADGLGSGVTPEQIQTSIDLGNEWLAMMKENDFSQNRAMANEKYRIARDLIQDVKQFAEPVETFKGNVSMEDDRMKEVAFKLVDLKLNSEKASKMLRVAKTLNFRNSDPAATYKAGKIREMISASEGNIQLGAQLNREADDFLDESTKSFSRLQSRSENILINVETLNNKVDSDRVGIARNFDLLQEAAEHASQLEQQATVLEDEVANAKNPAVRAIDAANAYQRIVAALKNANDGATKAMQAAEDAANMSVGVGTKASQSRERTQQLYEAASKNRDVVNNELQPTMENSLVNVEDVGAKNKVTKQMVEASAK
jgi:laminin alpha 3/5